MTRNLTIFLLFIFYTELLVSGQEKKKILALNGYVSTMQTAMFDSLSGSFVNDNIIHNRLNIKGFANDDITFAVEFRNRLFTGDMVKTETYSSMTSGDHGWMDLSWNVLDESSFFLNTTIDRGWVDFNYGKIQTRIGRQRINWGQTLVWNPNDIFNSYSFFDFDYIERPGSDAIRVQYYPGSSSVLEVAVKEDYKNDVTAAALYRFNRWGYDIQFLTGFANSRDIVFGSGWSGAFGSVSFRGELSWFQPADNFLDTTGMGIFTIGLDKSFPDNSLAQLQVMYCNDPLNPEDITSILSETMSAKELAFSRLTVFGQFSYPVTPLFNATVSAMWFTDLKGYFTGPSLEYSLAENIDFSLFWQHFKSNLTDSRTRINIVFLRVKYSF